jgi:hypothetical protein
MRTSTKILCAALALIITSLLVYDTKLKAEFLKGDFRKTFGDFVPANFSNFNSIELQSATAINLLVTKGPYKVMTDPTTGDFVKISQQGRKLVIKANFNDHYRSMSGDYVVFISCPDIRSFTSDARYSRRGTVVTDSIAYNILWRPTRITGFTSDSLTVTANNASNIVLENNHIGNLEIIAGVGPNTGPAITIGNGNIFNSARFYIKNKSTLCIRSAAGNHITYHIADSATLITAGAISKQMFKTTQP